MNKSAIEKYVPRTAGKLIKYWDDKDATLFLLSTALESAMINLTMDFLVGHENNSPIHHTNVQLTDELIFLGLIALECHREQFDPQKVEEWLSALRVYSEQSSIYSKETTPLTN